VLLRGAGSNEKLLKYVVEVAKAESIAVRSRPAPAET